MDGQRDVWATGRPCSGRTHRLCPLLYLVLGLKITRAAQPRRTAPPEENLDLGDSVSPCRLVLTSPQ